VQRDAGRERFGRTIPTIPHDRPEPKSRLLPKLMLAACHRFEFHQQLVPEYMPKSATRHPFANGRILRVDVVGRPGSFQISLPNDVPADHRNGPTRFRSSDDSQVKLVNASTAELLGESAGRLARLGEENDPTNRSIEPMHEADVDVAGLGFAIFSVSLGPVDETHIPRAISLRQ
jgi:hypothetical protein